MDFSALKPYDWLLIAQGTLVTIGLCTIGLLFGSVIGGLACIPTVFPRLRSLRILVIAYVEFFRATPLLLQLIAIYFALPLFGYAVPPLFAASLALVLYSGAYLTEIFRGGLEAVPRGQWEASLSLGLARWQVVRYVILPQTIRVIIPAAVSFSVMLVKGSAVVSVIGYLELTRAGRLVVDWTREAFAVWILVALIYLVICYPLSVWGTRLERRFKHAPDPATGEGQQVLRPAARAEGR